MTHHSLRLSVLILTYFKELLLSVTYDFNDIIQLVSIAYLSQLRLQLYPLQCERPTNLIILPPLS